MRQMLYALVASLCLLIPTAVRAMEPRHVSDRELAEYPIIVLGHWEKSAVEWKTHKRWDKSTGRFVTINQRFTKLKVTRAIRGDILPGACTLKLGYGIAWAEDGTGLESGTSTQLLGDVDDVTRPCLWFLRPTRTDGTFVIDNYREIQPQALESFYSVLRYSDAQDRLPQLLDSGDPLVIRRVLHHFCGEIWPWPFQPSSIERLMLNQQQREPVWNACADDVWAYLRSSRAQLRPHAVSVFAYLEGEASSEKLQSLLDDDDRDVRAVAAAILVRQRHRSVLPKLVDALDGEIDGRLACRLIDSLRTWNEDQTVAALFSFLAHDEFCYVLGDDVGIPALLARNALHEKTDCWFPYDKKKSLSIWNRALDIPHTAERKAFLQASLSEPQCPFTAEAVDMTPVDPADGDRDVALIIRLTNIAKTPQAILKTPDYVEMGSHSGTSGYGDLKGRRDKQDVFVVAAGESVDVPVPVDDDFARQRFGRRRLTLAYYHFGQSVDVKSWIGQIRVSLRELPQR